MVNPRRVVRDNRRCWTWDWYSVDSHWGRIRRSQGSDHKNRIAMKFQMATERNGKEQAAEINDKEQLRYESGRFYVLWIIHHEVKTTHKTRYAQTTGTMNKVNPTSSRHKMATSDNGRRKGRPAFISGYKFRSLLGTIYDESVTCV